MRALGWVPNDIKIEPRKPYIELTLYMKTFVTNLEFAAEKKLHKES